ncbi:alpha/beta hydrolase fold domain-containing protein [Nakamurella sp. YIM 132087]|uniref:Alpha/beta hydrolase fold domain-containing protein n=1 Tax=Nakamurella alba TaxID=2665158 RepID=A0A7K1FJ90_9ACTN|nr:alpha/beta hydrolase [Nakamurella alba]MTD14192.1 alpha/beta hydrolase fold domain-containing protein [Nakamurella alba]
MTPTDPAVNTANPADATSTRTDPAARAAALYRAVFDPSADPSLRGLRGRFDRMLDEFPLDDTDVVDEITVAGRPALTVAPAGGGTGVLLWFHGGGYVIGSPAGYRHLGSALARVTGRTVILPDYRLAPKYPFPAAPEDATAILGEVLQAHPSAVLGGDSAGGGLALVAMTALRDSGGALPTAAVLLSPLADLTGTSASVTEHSATDPAVTATSLADIRAAYLQGHDPADPRASPVFADLHGLPPVLVMAGGSEALLDDARTVADRIGEAGGTVELVIGDGMVHVWPLFESFLPEAAVAMERIGGFVGAVQTVG